MDLPERCAPGRSTARVSGAMHARVSHADRSGPWATVQSRAASVNAGIKPVR